jgi:hypothetical protein
VELAARVRYRVAQLELERAHRVAHILHRFPVPATTQIRRRLRDPSHLIAEARDQRLFRRFAHLELIVSANIANLYLARGVDRQKEFASVGR